MADDDRLRRERDLRRAVLAGDEAAWQTLYDGAFAGLYAYAVWRCGGLRDRADEVVQETWLVAVRRIRAFDPAHGPFLAWLRGIAANTVRNHLRRARRRTAEPLDGADPPVWDGADRDQRERAEQIARALAALPERYEAVLRAKYLEQRSVDEIAADWRESAKAIESLLTRARRAFRDAYPEDTDASIREGPP